MGKSIGAIIMVNFSIFNENSLPLEKGTDIKASFKIFFELLKELKKYNITTLRCSQDFKNYIIIGNDCLQILLGKIDRDLKNLILTLVANKILKFENPLIKEDEEEETKLSFETDFELNNKKAYSLGCSYIWNALAISFYSEEKWDKDNISFKSFRIDTKNNILERKIKVKHASRLSHLESHQDYFDKLRKFKIQEISKDNFFEKRNQLFSKIEFCKEVEEQVQEISKNVFMTMLEILSSLDNETKDIDSFRWSNESKSVKDNSKLNQIRTFTLPNGEKQVFFNHIKSLPEENRMYFIEKDSKIIIGYIGKHLSTTKYKC